MKVLRSIVVLIVVALLVCCSGYGKDEFTGHWQGKITLPETGKSLTDIEVFISRKGASVSGTINFAKVPNGSLPFSGRIDGEQLTLASEEKSGLSVTFKGTMRSPRLIQGTGLLVYRLPHFAESRQDRTAMELYR
jgi:hypothetical protein